MRLIALLVAFLSPWISTSAHAEYCRQALVLALDVSGSVNETEYANQLNGLASALNAPDVRELLLSDTTAPVNIAVFVWSSRNHQTLIQDWRAIDSEAALDSVILQVRSFVRRRAGLKTALGTALLFSAELLRQRRNCWKLTIDVSGDGENNIGSPPQEVYRRPEFLGVTVNALVVGEPGADESATSKTSLTKFELANYFEQNVIRGPGAFTMIAWGYADYARAMREKLLREVAAPVYGCLAECPK